MKSSSAAEPGSMGYPEILLLFGSGILAGAVNALAGGGTIFAFSALLAVGMPAVTANATSAVSVLPGQIASAMAYRRAVFVGVDAYEVAGWHDAA